MKTLLFILSVAFVSLSWAQADIPMDWNVSLTESGKIGIYHPMKEKAYTATIMVDYGGQVYSKQLRVEAGEWGFVNFPEDFDFTYEDMPEGSGAIEVNLAIQGDGEMIYNEQVFLTARNSNQPYEVNISEIEDRINLYGSIIDDCIFWHDNSGYNYIIRSHNEGKGIYLAHWVMDVSGGTEQINYYKGNFKGCDNGQELVQGHAIGWALEDMDQNGYMEFYAFLKDGCAKNWEHPTPAKLFVFDNRTENLVLEGYTYSLLENPTDIGGNFEASSALKKHPKLLQQAEEAWEVYVME